MTRQKVKSILRLLSIIAVFVLLAILVLTELSTFPTFGAQQPQVIIDAGHGLPDGGAVADDGTMESTLNLAICNKLYALFKEAGINCIMTRSDENGIYSDSNSIRSKKVSDIKNRIEIAGKYPNAIFVSVHMNTFSDSSVHGAQVFYKSDSKFSQTLAATLQSLINESFQKDNTKISKPVPKNVYLFNNISNETILVECGFLTNSDDLKNLKDENFQQQMAQKIFIAVNAALKSDKN